MTAFAKAQLMKYGWTEGKGLGKNETGITAALRPKLKFDTHGIGHKEDPGNEWWEAAFNKAADSIKVENNSDKISISVAESDTASKPEKRKLPHHYGNFLKASTLKNGTLIPEVKSENLVTENLQDGILQIRLTDEELFKACGGRTAHKGARHGLKLNGKLERIARQEQELLDNASVPLRFKEMKKEAQTSKLDKGLLHGETETDDNANAFSSSLEGRELSKSEKRKHKKRMKRLSQQLDVSCSLETDRKKKEKTKRKRELIEDDDVAMPQESRDLSVPEVKKEKLEPEEDPFSDEYHLSKSKLKSRKKKDRAKKKHQGWQEFLAKLEQKAKKLETSRKKHDRSMKEDIDLELGIKKEGAKDRTKADAEFVHRSRYDPEAFKIADRMEADANWLNSRIVKKKNSKLKRKERVKLSKLIEGLNAVQINNEESTQEAKGKIGKAKVEAIAKDLMTVNLTEDVSKTFKEKRKSKKKRG